MPPSAYRAKLAVALTNGGAETTVYVDSLQTMTGEDVTFSIFSPFTRGIITVDPEGINSDQPEFISFTGIDTTNIAFTGSSRGLSALSNSVVTDNIVFHPVSTPVIIAWGGHNISDLISYVSGLVAAIVVGTNTNVIGTAGETLAAGNLVYLKNDGKWWLSDADTAGTVDSVQLGIAQGAGTAGNAITNGVLLRGLDTNQSGLAAGTTYYASNTAGGISSSAGTTSRIVGVGKSSTTLYFDSNFGQLPTVKEKTLLTALLAGTGSVIYGADSVGTDAYAITISPAPTAYAAGMIFNFKAGTANTGAATLKINSLAAVTIKKNFNSDLATGDILANQVVSVIHDGTNFQVVSPMSKSLSTVATGNSTHDISTTGAQTIAHGLGMAPKLVRLTATFSVTNVISSMTFGTYDGTTNQCSYILIDTSGTNNLAALDSSNAIRVESVVGGLPVSAQAPATVDSTNITLTWTKTGSPTGTVPFFWEAIA